MLPTVNGKSFMDCTQTDLQVLIDNPDYRENEYIDYKATFAFLEIEKNDPRKADLLAEFRSDICHFANAEGGYLIYGIKDKQGMASKIVGITIPNNNLDKFELERKNNLVPIMPKLPPVKFKFIPLENQKYVVIIAVSRDSYAPYLHLEGEKDFRMESMNEIVEFAEVGAGSLPIAECIEVGKCCGCEFFFIEQDMTYDRTPLEAVKISYDNLCAMGYADMFNA